MSNSVGILDLRGQRCPLNFAHAKVAVQQQLPGQQVNILCAASEAKQLLASLQNLSEAAIISTKRLEDTVNILVVVQ